MNTHDPFSAFGGERTIIKPRLGQAPLPANFPTTGAAGAAPMPAAAPEINPESLYRQLQDQSLAHHHNPLLHHSTALLRMGVMVGRWAHCATPSQLAHTWNTALQNMDARLAEAARPAHERLACKYLMCTFLDECAANTPWGGSGSWASFSLLRTQFNETWGGEKCFQLLRQLMQNPVENRCMLELMAWVLSLGFRGKYHIEHDGMHALEELRKSLFRTLYPAHTTPSLHPACWASKAPKNHRRWLQIPLWLPISGMALVLAMLFLSFYIPLNRQAGEVFERLSGIRYSAAEFSKQELIDTPVQLGLELPVQLQDDIRSGSLTLRQKGNQSVIIFTGDGLFDSGSATVKPSAQALIRRVSEVLVSHPGNLTITGYTDAQPIRSLRFPSNWQLSAERARHVGELMGVHLPNRAMSTEGAGAANPIAPNDTPAGRARNRRVEVTLIHSNP
ncbi:type IVB secretion system protein IcmH/DotU [Limnobacter sp.]|uniref:type IVB secretion system protein IcmH/DotU n=1 Tax=Limnobacter sp. TaxID=2003368 RepID=UPI00351812A0